MNAGFVVNCLGLDGWGKRVAVTVFLLMVWLNPAVHAAAAGVFVPFPDKGEDRARHKRPVEIGNMAFPGTINPSPVNPVTVHQLYPNDGAIFPPKATVALSWRMPDEKALPESLRRVPKYFRVEMTSHTDPVTTTVKYFPYNEKSPTYHGLFTTDISGKYGWQVSAVMNDDSIIKSSARYFIVRQPYYYNHYFTEMPEIHPHYYYSAHEFTR